jgi:siroheme synthase
MGQKVSSFELELAEFIYASVSLVGARDGDPRHLSPLAVHALDAADAVIHDLAAPRQLLDLVRLSHYRKALLHGSSSTRSYSLPSKLPTPSDRVIERSLAKAPVPWCFF